MPFDRDMMAATLVGTGGAWLLGSALLRSAGRWNAVQRRGLTVAGTGFLLSAIAARWLQGWGRWGIAVTLVGTVLAMRGMLLLVRERAAQRKARGASDPPR